MEILYRRIQADGGSENNGDWGGGPGGGSGDCDYKGGKNEAYLCDADGCDGNSTAQLIQRGAQTRWQPFNLKLKGSIVHGVKLSLKKQKGVLD